MTNIDLLYLCNIVALAFSGPTLIYGCIFISATASHFMHNTASKLEHTSLFGQHTFGSALKPMPSRKPTLQAYGKMRSAFHYGQTHAESATMTLGLQRQQPDHHFLFMRSVCM